MLCLIFMHVDYTAQQQKKRRYSIFIFICNKISYRVRIFNYFAKTNRYSCGDILILDRASLLTLKLLVPGVMCPCSWAIFMYKNNEKNVENHSLKKKKSNLQQ